MNKFIPSFWLTYWKKVSSKSFIIQCIITILIIVGLSNIDKIIAFFDKSDQETTAIYSEQKDIASQFKKQFEALEKKGKYKIVSSVAAGEKGVKNEDYKKFIEIKVNKDQTMQSNIYALDNVGNNDVIKVQSLLTTFQSNIIAQNLNLKPGDLQKITAQSKVDTKVISKEDKKIDEGSLILNKGIVYVGAFLIFMITMTYGSQIATEIAQEKTSRLIEMIVTSVSPITHLMAKILAMIAVAFTNIIIIGLAIGACLYIFDINALLDKIDLKFTAENIRLIVYMVIFLILGLIMYIAFSTIVGALTNRIEDIGQAIMPVTFMNIAAFYITIFSLQTPDTMLVKISSYVPFLTPQVMLLRAASTKTSDMTIIIGIVICIVTIVLLLMLAARIYKGSVFSYEKGLIKNFKRALQMK